MWEPTLRSRKQVRQWDALDRRKNDLRSWSSEKPDRAHRQQMAQDIKSTPSKAEGYVDRKIKTAEADIKALDKKLGVRP